MLSVLLPPEIDSARRLARVKIEAIAAAAGLSPSHTANVLAGRKPAPPQLIVALHNLNFLPRAKVQARSLLAALEPRR
jgi:hypothetical protein